MFGTASSMVLYKDYSYYDGENYISLKDPYVIDQESRRISYLYQIYKKILRTNYFKS
jgi:hypothetical protein